MSVLTETLKVKIRHHFGYVNVSAIQTFVLGSPASLETQFMIEGAMNKVLPAAVPELERQVAILDGIEQQSLDDLELLAVNKVGEIDINQKEQGSLVERYSFWLGALENLLGVPRNPFDKRPGLGGAGGINARVVP